MLTINPSSLRATLNDAAGSPLSGGASSAPGSDPAGFAALLRQTQAAPAAAPRAALPTPVAPPAAHAAATPPKNAGAAGDAPDDAQTQHATGAANRSGALLKGRLRSADPGAAAPRGPRLAAGPAGNDGATPSQGATDKNITPPAADPAAAGAPLDPNLLHWLAAAQRTSAGDAAGASRSADAAATGATHAAGSDAADSSGAARGLRAGDPKDKAADKARLGAAADADHFAAALAEPRGVDPSQAQPATALAGIGDAAPSAPHSAALATPAAARSEAAAPVVAALATPVTAAEFPQALGVQISVLARDGVQHAELHLNPAEMGPVSVQIVMDGTQAHVDFGADLAATRQAIEAGLPELASALREAGFTLAGGGVSQHTRGRPDGADGADEPSGRGTRRGVGSDASATIDLAPRAGRRTVSVGGLDVYA